MVPAVRHPVGHGPDQGRARRAPDAAADHGRLERRPHDAGQLACARARRDHRRDAGPRRRADRARRRRAAERPAAGRRAGSRDRAAPGARRRPGGRGAPRPRALRAGGDHELLRPRLRRRGRNRAVRDAPPARRAHRPRALRRRPGRGGAIAGEHAARRPQAARPVRARLAPAALGARLAPGASARPAARRAAGDLDRRGQAVPRRRAAGTGADGRRARALRRNDEPRRALHGQPGPRADAPRRGARRFPAAHPRDRRPCRAHRARRGGGDAPRRRADRLAALDCARRARLQARPAALRPARRHPRDVVPVGQAGARLDRQRAPVPRSRAVRPLRAGGTAPCGGRTDRVRQRLPGRRARRVLRRRGRRAPRGGLGAGVPAVRGDAQRRPRPDASPGTPRDHDQRRLLDAPGPRDRLPSARQAGRPDRARPQPVRDPDDDISETRVDTTMVGGRVVFDR